LPRQKKSGFFQPWDSGDGGPDLLLLSSSTLPPQTNNNSAFGCVDVAARSVPIYLTNLSTQSLSQSLPNLWIENSRNYDRAHQDLSKNTKEHTFILCRKNVKKM
jgi:hypothetical protein